MLCCNVPSQKKLSGFFGGFFCISLSYLLHFGNVTNEGDIVGELVELLQLAEVLDVVLADHLHTHSSTERLFEPEWRERGRGADAVLRLPPQR